MDSSTVQIGNNAQEASLKSRRIGRVLIVLLWLLLGLTILSSLLRVVEIGAPSIYHDPDDTAGAWEALVLLITIVVFIIWMYRLHSDLRALFEDYLITPRAAMERLLVPLYNLWGLWNIFATLADHLKREGGALAQLGSSLRGWLLWLYLAGILSNVLSRAAFGGIFDDNPSVAVGLALAAGAATVLARLVWLQMARIITRALYQLSKREIA